MKTVLDTGVQSVLLLASLLALASCSNPERDFKEAEQANTEQAYESFIKKHPDSPLVAQAKTKIEQNAYEAARRTTSAAAYENFLKRFRDGSLAAKAKAELESLEFLTASKASTASSWRAFLAKYPSSTNAPLAQSAIADLVLPEVIATNTVQAYESFAVQYPNTKAATNALQRMMALEYATSTNANNISAYESFLLKHPQSEYDSDIRARLAPQLDERDWNQALLQNTPEALGTYYDAHTNTSRLICYKGTVRSALHYSMMQRPTPPYQTLQIARKNGSITEIRGMARVTGVVVTVDQQPDFVKVLSIEEAARLQLSDCQELIPNTFRCTEDQLAKTFENARLFIQKTGTTSNSLGRIMVPLQVLSGSETAAIGTLKASDQQNAEMLRAATNRVGVVNSTKLQASPVALTAAAEFRASSDALEETINQVADPEQRRIKAEDALRTMLKRRQSILESLRATLKTASAKVAQAKGLSMILSGADSAESHYEVLFANGDEKLVAGLLRASPALAKSLINAAGTDVTDQLLLILKEMDLKREKETADKVPPK